MDEGFENNYTGLEAAVIGAGPVQGRREEMLGEAGIFSGQLTAGMILVAGF